MKKALRLQLQTSETQTARLLELQKAFATVCNALAPLAQQTRCWNRVALHHMAYKSMRQQFPGVGSQMVCNAIYSVSRACRHIYQHPSSPFNLQRLAGRNLPRVQFQPQAPVYFDRHTLSIKGGQVSMYTLDGRMRFHMALSDEHETRFRTERLREIVLTSSAEKFYLSFFFAADESSDDESLGTELGPDLPEYMLIIEDDAASPVSLPTPNPQRAGAIPPHP